VSRPKFTLRILGPAEDDLVEAVTFIAADNPSAAEALLTKIEKGLAALTELPQIGRAPDDAELIRMGYRYLIIEDYLIFYTIGERTILVHRIMHGARNYRNLL